MSKGIFAFVVMTGLILAISILSGIGFYDNLALDYSSQGMDDDVQSAADALTSQEATDTGGTAVVEFTTGAANVLQVGWEVVSNTSGVLKLLFNLPDAVADPFETFFQIAYGLTFAGFIRGVMPT